MAWNTRVVVFGSVALTLLACETIIGADFDEKSLGSGGTPSGDASAGNGGQGGTASGGSGGGGGTPLLQNGAPCAAPAECQSDLCVDDVCCDDGCDGECRLCNLTGSEGTCTPLAMGAPCPVTPGGSCDGVRFCATGNHLWSSIHGGAGEDLARGCAFDQQGHLWVAGVFADEIDFTGGLDPPLEAKEADQLLFLARFDVDGNHVASLPLGNDDPVDPGDFDLDDLVIDGDGNIVIAAHIDGTIDVGGGLVQSDVNYLRNLMVLSLTPQGGYRWHHLYKTDDEAPRMHLAARDGRVAVAVTHESLDFGPVLGTQTHPGFGHMVSVVAHDAASGDPVWATHSVNTLSTNSALMDIGILPSGRIVALGEFNGGDITWGPHLLSNNTGDVMVVAFDDADGAVSWASRYGGFASQVASGLAVLGNGHVALAGSFLESINIGGDIPHHLDASENGLYFDGFVARIDGASATGEPVPGLGVPYGPLSQAYWRHYFQLTADSAGNVVFSGQLYGAEYEIDGVPLPPNVDGHTFVKLAADGLSYLWVKSFGVADAYPPVFESVDLYPWKLATAPDGRIAICGHTTDAVDYGGGTLATSGERDAIIAVFAP